VASALILPQSPWSGGSLWEKADYEPQQKQFDGVWSLGSANSQIICPFSTVVSRNPESGIHSKATVSPLAAFWTVFNNSLSPGSLYTRWDGSHTEETIVTNDYISNNYQPGVSFLTGFRFVPIGTSYSERTCKRLTIRPSAVAFPVFSKSEFIRRSPISRTNYISKFDVSIVPITVAWRQKIFNCQPLVSEKLPRTIVRQPYDNP
jgi:hypothetical protein